MEILVIALPILTIIVFTVFFVRMRRPRKVDHAKDDHRTRQERAVWAWGKILAVKQGPLNSFRMARTELQIEVHMPGTPVYQADTTWLVEQDSLPSLEEGKEVSLKVDPLDPKYIYPSGTWAQYLD
jgi:hypothetical protein